MEFDTLLEITASDPLFESSLFLSGNVNPNQIRVQLARWVKMGKILQIRRGLYALASPYQKLKPHPFYVANHLQRASCVSLQSALSLYGLIPELVSVTTSVTTGRPERLETPLGTYEFRHIKTPLLFGYHLRDFGGQSALVASPEKALLDLIYLHPVADPTAYLAGLRLQNTGLLDQNLLIAQAERFGTPKMRKMAKEILRVISAASAELEDL